MFQQFFKLKFYTRKTNHAYDLNQTSNICIFKSYFYYIFVFYYIVALFLAYFIWQKDVPMSLLEEPEEEFEEPNE